jgi:hypothetical protein
MSDVKHINVSGLEWLLYAGGTSQDEIAEIKKKGNKPALQQRVLDIYQSFDHPDVVGPPFYEWILAGKMSKNTVTHCICLNYNILAVFIL